MTKDGDRLNTDNLATTDERVELGALLQLVLDALAASRLIHPGADLVLLQPVATIFGLDALVDDGALVQETPAPVAAVVDVAAVALAHPLC